MVSKNKGLASAAFRLLRQWRATIITAALGGGQILLAIFAKLDLVKLNIHFLERLQPHALDNIVVSIPLVLMGLAIDVFNRRKQHEIEIATHRLHILQATMRTVQDIVNNLLNNLQLFRLEAESALPEPRLEELDTAIENAAKEIRALGNVDVVREKEMASGTGIDCSLGS